MTDGQRDGKSTLAALLFIDVLGTKARWAAGGSAAAAALFDKFAGHVETVLRSDPDRVVSGAIESDCAALICPSASDAVSVGIELYEGIYFGGRIPRSDEERLWVRGVIVALPEMTDVRWLRTPAPLASDLPHITRETYAPPLLDAIAMEKAGFRGMRLLIPADLVTPRLRTQHRVDLGNHKRLLPFKTLQHSTYPSSLVAVQDVLWMACTDEEEWRDRRRRMSSRMRLSSRQPDEVLQAAATQIVFDECDAIMTTERRTAPRRIVRRSSASGA